MVKITNFMIGLVILGVIVTGLSLFTIDLGLEYGTTMDEDFTEYTALINKTNTQAGSIREKLETGVSTDSSIVDRLGAFLGAGYDAVLLIGGSVDNAYKIIEKSAEIVGIPGYIVTAFTTILVILIFIGIILAILVKSDV